MRRLPVVLCTSVLALTACGGGAGRGRAPAAAGPVPDVVRQLQAPETPDRIIYAPPVSLAKPPDTTAHGRKPRS
jgi:hypothetical protein